MNELSDVAEMRDELIRRTETLESAYELMLAYAAQGLEDDRGSRAGAEMRERMQACVPALEDIADLVHDLAPEGDDDSHDAWHDLLDALERDAGFSRAAFILVLGREAIASELIDNLNASIHVRALLTDLFLVDELLD